MALFKDGESAKVQTTIRNAEKAAAHLKLRTNLFGTTTNPFLVAHRLRLPLKSYNETISPERADLWLDHDGLPFLVMPFLRHSLVRKKWGSSGTSPCLQRSRLKANPAEQRLRHHSLIRGTMDWQQV